MANTAATTSTVRGGHQFGGAFNDMWLVTVGVTDSDANNAGNAIGFAVTVPGVELGDMVLGIAPSVDVVESATQTTIWSGYVTDADEVTLIATNVDTGNVSADDYIGTYKVLIGRPSW